MAAKGGSSQQEDAGMIFIALIVFVILMFFIYDYIKPILHKFFMYVAYVELIPVSYFVDNAAIVKSNIFTHVPEELTFKEIAWLLNYAGKWYIWFVIGPYICYRLYDVWVNSLSGKFSRNLNMKKLLANNIKNNPCIAPIVNWPRSILEEPMDSGYWKTARQPIQYAVENELLLVNEGKTKRPVKRSEILDKSGFASMKSKYIRVAKSPLEFDREKCRELMLKQMGPRFEGFHKMPKYMQKLCCAFVLYATGDKKRAQKILDQMSLSFRGPSPATPAKFVWYPPFYLPARKAQSKFELNDSLPKDAKKILSEGLALAKGHTCHTYMVVLALYEAARSKGVLNTAEFIWLRPVNRKLFYLCNNYGRLVAWTEIAGPWNHYQAEKLMAEFDLDSTGIEEPDVLQAVNALETCMYEEGWLEELSKEAKESLPLGAMD